MTLRLPKMLLHVSLLFDCNQLRIVLVLVLCFEVSMSHLRCAKHIARRESHNNDLDSPFLFQNHTSVRRKYCAENRPGSKWTPRNNNEGLSETVFTSRNRNLCQCLACNETCVFSIILSIHSLTRLIFQPQSFSTTSVVVVFLGDLNLEAYIMYNVW